MKRLRYAPCWLLLLLCHSLSLFAGDFLLEQQIQTEIETSIQLGEVVTLKAGEDNFMGIRTPAQGSKIFGAVLLLHDLGLNPDAAQVIHPLRTYLPAHGWETLSLQLPLMIADTAANPYATMIPQALPRLTFALELLGQQNLSNVAMFNVAVIGHGLGAQVAAEWLRQTPPPAVAAYVAVSLNADGDDGAKVLAALERIKIPVLDIYGSLDLPSVVRSAPARAAAARRGQNTNYRQLMIDSADHDFRNQNDILRSRVRAWLNRMAPSGERRG